MASFVTGDPWWQHVSFYSGWMRSPARFFAVLGGIGVSALGSLIIHQIAYLAVAGAGLFSTGQLFDHGHLSAQWAVVTPIAVLGASGFVLRQVQQLGLRNPLSVRSTAAGTLVLFVGQEILEGLVAGHSALSVLTSPAVLIGIALAPLVAFAMARFLDGFGDLVARVLDRSSGLHGDSFPIAQAFFTRRTLIPIPVRSVGSGSPRGPPARRSSQR